MSHTHHAAKVSHVPVLPATLLLAIPSLPHSSLPSLLHNKAAEAHEEREGGGGGQKSTVKTLNCMYIYIYTCNCRVTRLCSVCFTLISNQGTSLKVMRHGHSGETLTSKFSNDLHL